MKLHSFLLLSSLFLIGCGHTSINQVGLMSLGDLEGKSIPEKIEGKRLSGQSCGFNSFLSNALRDAVKETAYDTLVDVTVTSETGLFVANNCVKVDGSPLDSKKL